jgi:hypothetical protein
MYLAARLPGVGVHPKDYAAVKPDPALEIANWLQIK